MPKYSFFLDLCLAISIDIPLMTETIAFGPTKEIVEWIKNNTISNGLVVSKREIGAFLADLSMGFRMENYVKGTAVDIPPENTTCTYIKTVIDKYMAQDNIPDSTTEWLLDNLEITQTRLINQEFEDFQRHISYISPNTPDADKIIDYRLAYYKRDENGLMSMMNTKTNEIYVLTDVFLIEIVDYYIRQLYKSSLYPRICMNCNRVFISKSNKLDVLCSNCKKESNIAKNTKYRQNHYDDKFLLYKKSYNRWYTRLKRSKVAEFNKSLLFKECLDRFAQFVSESNDKVHAVQNGDITYNAFVEWINTFEANINQLWKSVKAEKRNN